MNSESGKRLSTEELKNRVMANAAMAAATQTTVILTDQNWGALNNSVTLLAEMAIRNTDSIQQLMTREHAEALLNGQETKLREDLTATEDHIEFLLGEMEKREKMQSGLVNRQTQESLKEISSLAGREKESFSSACSEMKDGMRSWLKKTVWISLIPSGLVLVLELLRLILSAV